MQCIGKLFSGSGSKTTDADIAGIIVYHISGIEAVYGYLIALDGNRNESCRATTHHLNGDFSTSFATQTTHHIFCRHLYSGYQRIVYLYDTVASQYSGLLRRSARDSLYNEQSICSHIKLNSDTVEVALQRLVQLLHLFGVGISRMRIELL